MSNRSWSSFLLRFGLLVGVLAALGTALVWQRITLNKEAKRIAEEARTRHIPKASMLFDELSQQKLAVARAKSAEIAGQRQALRTKSFVPDLGVPVVKTATTRRKFQEEYARYRLRYVDDYRKLTEDPAGAKGAGERFLESFLRETSKMDFSDVDYANLDLLGLAAIQAGSDDPLLRIFQTYAHWWLTSDAALAEREWQKILVRLRASRYPRRAHAELNRYLLDAVRRAQPQKQADQAQASAVAMAQWLEEEGDDPEWRRAVCSRLWSFWPEHDAEAQKQLLTECLQHKQVNEYLVHLMLGAYHLNNAWNTRGSGLASSVSAAQWKGFEEQAGFATDHLQYAWSLHPEMPYAPAILISAALASSASGETSHFWFLRTLEAQFDYHDAYVTMLHTLLPRWGGSHEQMLSFGQNCLGTDQFTTTVPYFVVDVLQKLQTMEKMDLRQMPVACAMLRELIDKRNAYRAKAPDAGLYEDDGAYHADLILLLEQCGLPDLAAQEVVSAGDKIFWYRLQQDGRPGRYLAQRLVAGQAQDRQRVLAFDQRLRQPWSSTTSEEELEWLTDEYQQLSQAPAAKQAEKFYQQAGTVLAQLRQFSDGDWVDLPFNVAMNGWEPACYRWYVNNDGSVELTSSGLMGLRPLANFHPPFEVEASLELITKQALSAAVGIAWHQDELNGPPQLLQQRQKFLLGLKAGSALRGDDSQALRDMTTVSGVSAPSGFRDLPSAGVHLLKAKLWQDYVEFMVDDTFTVAAPPRRSLDQQGYLYFGTIQDIAGRLRWGSIRIRKLTAEEPPTANHAYLFRQRYWQHRHADSPDDPSTIAPICQLYFEQGRSDELVALADRHPKNDDEATAIAYWRALALLEYQKDEAGAMRELANHANSAAVSADALALLGDLYTTASDSKLRDGQKAMGQCAQALVMTDRRHAAALAATAAAYAATGDFPAAIKYQQEALDRANEPQEAEWLPRLAEYKAGRPYRRTLSITDAK